MAEEILKAGLILRIISPPFQLQKELPSLTAVRGMSDEQAASAAAAANRGKVTTHLETLNLSILEPRGSSLYVTSVTSDVQLR